jgi:hypothetical protein
MFSLTIKLLKLLGSLLPLLGALQLMKFTLNDQLAAHGLRIPAWVTEATVIAFTAVFLMSLTALLMGRNRQAAAGNHWGSAAVRRRYPSAPSGKPDADQTRFRQRLNGLSNYL